MRVHCALKINGLVSPAHLPALAHAIAGHKPYAMDWTVTPQAVADRMETEDFWEFEKIDKGLIPKDLKEALENASLEWAWIHADLDDDLENHITFTAQETTGTYIWAHSQVCVRAKDLTPDTVLSAKAWQNWWDTATVTIAPSAHAYMESRR